MSLSGLETEHKGEELLVGYLDPPIAVGIICLEGVCQGLWEQEEIKEIEYSFVTSLQHQFTRNLAGGTQTHLYHYTTLDEIVKCNCPFSCAVKLSYEQVIETIWQAVAKACQCCERMSKRYNGKYREGRALV